MLVIKIPRWCKTPVKKTAVASGLALAVALKRIGNFEEVGVALDGKRVGINLDAGDDVKELANNRWNQITVTLTGMFGSVRLGVDINVYANECFRVWKNIGNEVANVVAKPRSHTGGKVIQSFYELFDIEHEKMKAFVEEFITEISHTGYRKYVAGVYATLDGNLKSPEGTMPLLSNFTQFSRYLYMLSPPGLRELAGFGGMENVVKDTAEELLKYLGSYYMAKKYTDDQHDIIQLIPLSTKSHKDAVAGLRNILTETMREVAGRRAQKIIDEKGYLDWKEYVGALKEELNRRLQMRS
jgi:ribosomal protein S17E